MLNWLFRRLRGCIVRLSWHGRVCRSLGTTRMQVKTDVWDTPDRSIYASQTQLLLNISGNPPPRFCGQSKGRAFTPWSKLRIRIQGLVLDFLQARPGPCRKMFRADEA